MKNKLSLSNPFIFSLSVFIFLFISLFFKGGGQFYEAGLYIDFARSFINDYDLNLINQIPEEMGWILTPKGYYPEFHPIIQTPFLVIFNIIEKVSSAFTVFPEAFLPSGLLLNFSVLLGILFLGKEYCKVLLGSEKDSLVLLPLILGTTFLYFNTFTTTVYDCFSIPLLLYLLIDYQKLIDKDERPQPLCFGLALGLFFITKIIYKPLALYLLFRTFLRVFGRSKGILIIGFLIPLIIKATNSQLMFGSLFIEPHVGARVLMDFSFTHLIIKIWHGFFSQDGLFFLNPLILISLISFFYMGWKKYQRIDFFAFSIWIAIVFLHPVFVLGRFIEDQLPGRAILISLPFLAMGLYFIYLKFQKATWVKGIIWLLIGWNFWVVINFLIIDRFDIDLYYQDKFVTDIDGFNYRSFVGGMFELNFAYIKSSFPFLVVFSLLSGFSFWLLKHLYSFQKLSRLIVLFTVISLSAMTLTNLYFGPKNVARMKKEGLFKNKVIGNGSDIYLYDFLLDRFHSISLDSGAEVGPELDRRIKLYYNRIQGQIIQSTPQFDKQMRQNRWDSSFFQKKKNDKPIR